MWIVAAVAITALLGRPWARIRFAAPAWYAVAFTITTAAAIIGGLLMMLWWGADPAWAALIAAAWLAWRTRWDEAHQVCNGWLADEAWPTPVNSAHGGPVRGSDDDEFARLTADLDLPMLDYEQQHLPWDGGSD